MNNDIKSSYYRRSRTEMIRFVPFAARTILEIGCAEGYFGASLKRDRTVEVWGVELLAEAAAKAKKHIDRVLTGKIEDHIPSIPDGYFDCIVLNDVLEHLVDPWSILGELRPKLTGMGSVVASIPNVRHFPNLMNLLVRKDWEYTESGILDRSHLRFFTATSIRRMFEECGYELVSIQGMGDLTLSWRFVLLNRLVLNFLNDCRFLVFACVARSR